MIENKDKNTTQEMLSTIQQFYIPNRVLALINEDNPLFYHKSEIAKNIIDNKKNVTTVHICRNRVCLSPVTSIDSLKLSLNTVN